MILLEKLAGSLAQPRHVKLGPRPHQHEALGRGVESASRHAVERGILVDIAVMQRAQLLQIRDHVGPQILVAHKAGQQDEIAQSLGYFFKAFRIFPESVTKPKHFLTFHTEASVQKSGEVVAQQSSTMTQP